MESVNAEDLLETDHVSGPIWLERPARGEAVEPGFFPGDFGDALVSIGDTESSFDRTRLEVPFEQLLSTPWGTLCLIGAENTFSRVGQDRTRMMLEALERVRPTLDAAGNRFSGSVRSSAERPWWASHGPIYALANLGIETPQLDELREHGQIPDWRTASRSVTTD